MRNARAKSTKNGIMGSVFLAAIVAFGAALMASPALGQPAPAANPPASPPPAEAKYTGCVQRLDTDKDTLVLNGDTVCAKLTGKVTADNLAGHEVELNGVLTPGSRRVPASINVSSVATVGKSCSNTCSLLPPRSRGLGNGGQIPGKEGGTPGLSTSPPPQ